MTDQALPLAQALWIVRPGQAQLRAEALVAPAPGEVQVRALISGVSRGTESLVFHGRVPSSEHDRMRCPFQDGAFPYPVKYGYAMVGRVEAGPAERVGQRVFSLYPHQSRFNLPADAAIPIPDGVTDARAALAPQIETALNATWDAAPRIGDRIAVVGGGVIGALTAYLCARIPGADVTLIDVNPDRAALAQALGLGFATPQQALPSGCDLVFHASGSGEGLNLALSLAGFEASVVELSWYGDKTVGAALGGGFHSQRLSLIASQVGSVAPARRPRWDHRRRLTLALSLCADPALDLLVAEQTALADMPARLEGILADPATLCHLIRYPEA
jgi:NADPH:quinone reductase-like Zn-dependent oxidoreductase